MAGEAADRVRVGDVEVRGLRVDDETRCVHYASELDVVAIEFACCGTFYPCYRCHEALAGHEAETWSRSAREERAVLCGSCDIRLTIRAYLDSLEGDGSCPACGAPFNPGCLVHRHRYFEG